MIKGEWVLPTLNFISEKIHKKRRTPLKKQGIAKKVEELLRPTIEGLGYSIWDVEYAKIGSEWNLTVTIDRPEGIWISDCETVHRAIDPILDDADPIEDAYRLNVSSKGLEPELRTDAHILACIGEWVEARLFAQKDGKKSFVGYLSAYEDGVVVITDEDENELRLARQEISKLSVVYIDEEE
jgi:ribosome maturation factor RimP